MTPFLYLAFDLALAAALLSLVARLFPRRRRIKPRRLAPPKLQSREAEFLHDPETIMASVAQEAARQMKPLQFPDEIAKEALPADMTLVAPRHAKAGDVLVPVSRPSQDDLAIRSVLPFAQGGLQVGAESTLSEMIYRRGSLSGPDTSLASAVEFQDDPRTYYDDASIMSSAAPDSFTGHSPNIHTPGYDGTFFSDGGSHMGHGGTGGADSGSGFPL